MAGHSHWAGIKHKKALIDNKRGKLWSKLSKAIIVAARLGGGDPDANIRLRYAIDEAKAANMPNDTINRAIKKGTGELDGGNIEEIVYEGYGPAGVAVFCEIITDNRNRTAPEIRKIFEMADGKLGATGCVAWMFDRRGVFMISNEGADEDKVLEIALEAGADDVKLEGDEFQVTCDQAVFDDVNQALTDAGLKITSKEIARIPSTTVELGAEDGRKVLKLMERLDDHEDVQSVSANFDLPDEVMAEIEQEESA